MKIALLVTGGLHPSGREQIIPSLVALIERLARRHEIHAFVLRHLPAPSTYSLAGATVHDLGRPEGLWRQVRHTLRALRAEGSFDVVHGYWVDPAGLVAAVAGRRLHVPVVVTCDSGEFVSLPSIGYGLQRTVRGRSVVTLACRWATAVHVTSAHMAQLAAAQRIDATCIPLGVECNRRTHPRVTRAQPPWRVLQVASLNAVKDQSTLRKAVALARRWADIRLDLIGEDTLGGRLRAEAASLGIDDAVAFHGFVPHDALAAHFGAADLYVQSSLHEAAGVAVLEAAAAGVPIVGTRAGFVSDWDGRGAVAVPPGNPAALAGAMVALLRDPPRRAALSRWARAFAERHDADFSARAIEDLYRTVCKARHNNARAQDGSHA